MIQLLIYVNTYIKTFEEKVCQTTQCYYLVQEKNFLVALKVDYLNKIPTREPTPESAAEPEIAKNPATEAEVAKEPTKAAKVTKTKTKHKIHSLKLCERFLNEIKDERKNINEQTFNEFSNYHYPSFLVKDLMKKI